MKKLLTPKQVARSIGVSESSLKRWCDKGLLPTQKTAGGHRRLTADAVIQFLRSQGHRLVEPRVMGLPSNVGSGEVVVDHARGELLTALIEGDDACVRRVLIDLYLSRHSVCEIGDKVIADVMHHIGHRWQDGHIEVYRERRACEMLMRALFELREMLPVPPVDAPCALGGTIEGDPYQLANSLVEITLREAGWQATSLGASLPFATLRAAVRDARPNLVWLSVSSVGDADDFVVEFDRFYREAEAAGVAVVVGGRGLTQDLRARISYTAFCDNLRHVVAAAAPIAAARSRPSSVTSDTERAPTANG